MHQSVGLPSSLEMRTEPERKMKPLRFVSQVESMESFFPNCLSDSRRYDQEEVTLDVVNNCETETVSLKTSEHLNVIRSQGQSSWELFL